MNTSPRRFRRGESSPERPGLVFYTYHQGREYWTTPKKLEEFRERINHNARLQRKRNPEVHKRAFAKWVAKPGKLELKRQCYKNWVARPEGRIKRRQITARYIATPDGALINRIRSRIWHALEKGVKKSAHTEVLIGCTLAQFRRHFESLFQPGMTWKNMGAWEIDHRVCLAAFNLADPEQQKLAFNFRNCQPMWRKPNRVKSDFIQHNGKRVRGRDLRKANIIPFPNQQAA